MKRYFLICLPLIFFSCNNSVKNTSEKDTIENKTATREIIDEIQTLIDSSNSLGSVLIFKPSANTYYSNDFEWAEKGHLPASTFKIPNSIVALELGIIENDSSMFFWGGEDRFQERWERDMNFKEALQLSCVPCYQYLAREIGTERMINTLENIGYPGMVIDSSNIDLFWLQGESRITSFQQIDFLERFYNQELPISKNTFSNVKTMLLKEENEGFNLSGKSGWSYTNGVDNCWFIGYLEKEGEVYFFATNLQPPVDVDLNMYAQIRYEITINAFNIIQYLE